MNITEIENTISVLKSAQSNIYNWSTLKDREVAIIPTDSDYFKTFKEWIKSNNVHYDSEKEKSPMYISKDETNQLVDLMIKNQEDFIKPHKEKLSCILTDL